MDKSITIVASINEQGIKGASRRTNNLNNLEMRSLVLELENIVEELKKDCHKGKVKMEKQDE